MTQQETTVQPRRWNNARIMIFSVIIIMTVACWLYTGMSASGEGGMVMDMGAGADPAMDAAMEARLLAAAGGPVLPPFEMFVPMWIVMCIGMMLPTAIPMIFTMQTICEKRKAQGTVYAPVWIFTLGYLILWAVFGVVCWVAAYVIFLFIGDWLANWENLWLAVGGIFALAGIYQISPLKDACLFGCQHPLQFLMHNWREGKGGALWMGLKHGLTCVGCCSMLMIVMFPLGMMNLIWMGLFTIIMFVEKNAKFGSILSKIVGWILLVAGVIIAALAVAFML